MMKDPGTSAKHVDDPSFVRDDFDGLSRGRLGMTNIHPSFHRPAPRNWLPQVGERVRLLYQDKTYEGEIAQVLDEPAGYVVSSDDLLLPVVCRRNSLRPVS